MKRLVAFAVLLLLLPLLATSSHTAEKKAVEKSGKETVVLLPIHIEKDISSEYRQGYESAVKQSLSAKWQVYAGEMVKKAVDKAYSQRFTEAKAGEQCDTAKCIQDVAIAFQTELVAVATVVKGESGYMLSLSITNVMDDKKVYSNSLPCRDCDELAIVDKLKELYTAPQVAAKIPVAREGMVFVRGGCFDMGGNEGDVNENPRHKVCLDGFYMDKTEVTQGAYQRVIGSNPSNFKGCPACPVETVSWFEADAYCKKVGKRLPTEAEWEYAATSGGGKEEYAGTGDESKVGDYAWCDRNSGGETHPVGEKLPNGLGLYDMSGNVFEWTDSWYDDSKEYRVLRGGAWNYSANNLRTAFRFYNYFPGDRLNGSLGFRCSQY